MNSSCALCNDPRLGQIEEDINNQMPLGEVAEKYQIDEDAVRQYAVLYMKSDDAAEGLISIARKTKLKEAYVLEDTLTEYSKTLKKMSKFIHKNLDESEDNPTLFGKILTKSVSDMFVGLGGEIRQTVKTLSELDVQLNGPKNDNSSGLQALADAINNSRK